MLSARIKQVGKLVRGADLAPTAYGATALGSGLYAANMAISEHKDRDFLVKASGCTFYFAVGLAAGPPYFALLAATWPIRQWKDYQRK